MCDGTLNTVTLYFFLPLASVLPTLSQNTGFLSTFSVTISGPFTEPMREKKRERESK
jgi:hypothetical protein